MYFSSITFRDLQRLESWLTVIIFLILHAKLIVTVRKDDFSKALSVISSKIAYNST